MNKKTQEFFALERFIKCSRVKFKYSVCDMKTGETFQID